MAVMFGLSDGRDNNTQKNSSRGTLGKRYLSAKDTIRSRPCILRCVGVVLLG